MSASMRNFMEAYNAVHSSEAREELSAKRDEIAEMDLSMINDEEIEDICEEVLEELFEEGYTVEECEAIFTTVISEAKVTYGHDTGSAKAKKTDRLERGLKSAIGKVKMKAAKGAVKAYGAYRDAKASAKMKARRAGQTTKNMSAQAQRAGSEMKAKAKSGLKSMIKKGAKAVAKGAIKVAKRMSEGKRWQDDDGDGKWYEKSDVDGKISKREKKSKNHNCASKVKHEEFGVGNCIKGMHDLDENGVVQHYDVFFEHGIEKNVPVSSLEILEGSMHEHVIHEKRGLWDNIHAKRKRGEKPAKPGDKDYPKTLNVEGMEKARKNVGADKCWDGYKAKGTKMKGGKEVPNCKKEEVETVDELYKGKHGQTEKQYQDGRSNAGKMISGDSKGSGANYSYKAKNTGPNPAGGSKKPQGQARMGSKDREYLAYRRAELKKKNESFTEAELDAIMEVVTSWED